MDHKPNSNVSVGAARFGNELPLALIAGPCALESKAHALEMANALKEIAARVGIGFVYKTSFDKANRTSAKSARGLGLEQALPIFAEVREKLKVPVLTDVHDAEQCARVAPAVDVWQIPAFLCRQTDLLVAAAKTGKTVNVKKGQFLAPWDMQNVVEKISGAGNRNVLVTERCLWLIRSSPDIRASQTHNRSARDLDALFFQPGREGHPRVIAFLFRACAGPVAVGVAGIFHRDSSGSGKAADGPNMCL